MFSILPYISAGALLGFCGYLFIFSLWANDGGEFNTKPEVIVAQANDQRFSKGSFVVFVTSIAKELLGTAFEGTRASECSRRMIELATRIDNGEGSSRLFASLTSKNPTREDSFSVGAVSAARILWEPEHSTKLLDLGENFDLHAFMWGCAAALRVERQDVRNDSVTKVFLSDPLASVDAILPVAVLYEHEAIKIISAAALPNAHSVPDELYAIFRELLPKNPRFAARALLNLPSSFLHSLLRAEPKKWADLGAVYLEPLLDPLNVDLYQCPPEVVRGLLTQHPRSAARWASTNWGRISRLERPSFWALLQGAPELASKLLLQNFGSEDKSWLDIRNHLCVALVKSDKSAFVDYVSKLPQQEQETVWDETLMRANSPELVLEYGKTHSVSLDVLNSIAGDMAALSPEKLADFIAKLPSEAQREALGSVSATQLSMGKIDEGLALAHELLAKPDHLPDAASLKEMFYTVANNLVNTTGDTALAENWIEKLPNPVVRSQCSLEFGRQWALTEPYAASKYLLNQPHSPERDSILRKAAADIPDASQKEEILKSLTLQPGNVP